MSKPRQSILSVYYTFLIFILVAFIIMFSTIFKLQFDKLENLKRSEELIRVSTDLFAAVKSFGFERGRVNVVLNYKGDISDKLADIQFIEENRISGEQAVASALARISALDMPSIGEQIEKLNGLRAIINENRSTANKELMGSFSSRSSSFASRWFDDMSNYIDTLSHLAIRFNGLISNIGLTGKSYITLQENATLLRDNAGPACSYTAAAILSPDNYTNKHNDEIVLRYSKANENLYRISLAALNLKDPEITQAVHALQNQHFSQLQKALDSTLASLNENKPFRYTQPELTQLSGKALNSIKDLVDLSSMKMTEFIRHEKNERYNIIAAYIMMSVIAVLFFFNFINLLNRKIYLPTKDVIEKLKKLSEGDTDIVVKKPKYNDEISDLLISVRSFRDALIQISESNEILEETVRVRTEELLGKAHEIEMILDNIPVMIFFKDTSNNIIKANRAAAGSLGVDVSMLENVPAKDIFPRDHERYLSEDRDIIRHKKPIMNIAEFFQSEAKGDLIVNTSKIPLFDKDGEVKNILVVITDTTELVHAQRENQKSYQLLLQKSKMAEIGSMIGVISHQLKQPLNILSLLSETLTEEGEDLEFAKNSIRDTVLFMDGTIDEFLTFFKPSKDVETFYFSDVLCEVHNLVMKQLEKESISFEIIDEAPLAVTGYRNEMKQVILNIINNSRDAFESAKIKDRQVIIRYNISDELAEVTICDNAGGIPAYLLPDKLFELYSSDKGAEGNGIGLYICKNIMEEHMNGAIEAYNSEKGACFKITFKEFRQSL